MPAHLARELVITVPLPQDRGRQGDARPKVHRFRSHWLELGRRLRAFRTRYGLTQDEVAAVVGAAEGSAVSQWECGDAVPDGIRRERLIHLLEGRLWPDLRVAALEGDRLPVSWDRVCAGTPRLARANATDICGRGRAQHLGPAAGRRLATGPPRAVL